MESTNCDLHKIPFKHYCMMCKVNICDKCKVEKHSGLGHKVVELKVESGAAPEFMVSFNGVNFDLSKEKVNISNHLRSILWL